MPLPDAIDAQNGDDADEQHGRRGTETNVAQREEADIQVGEQRNGPDAQGRLLRFPGNQLEDRAGYKEGQ